MFFDKLYTLSLGIVKGSVVGGLLGMCTGTVLSNFEKKTEYKVYMIEKVTIGGVVAGGIVGGLIVNTPMSACILSSVCFPYYAYNKMKLRETFSFD